MSATNIKIGDIFGRLEVISKTDKRTKCGAVYWNCRCSCGSGIIKTVTSASLRNGHTKSCGCLKRELDSIKIKYINDNNLKRYVIKLNEYIIEGDITYIILNNGNKTIIDTDCIEMVNSYTWTKYTNGYCYNVVGGIMLHRLIMNITDSNILIDHINHNTLDNRRENLRIVNRQQNSFNSKPINGKETKGIRKDPKSERWISQICISGKIEHIGRYDKKEDAIFARIEKEKELQGEYRYEWEKDLDEIN